jgi:pimeloyl-ACP methyl ester carboxylesterase
MNLIVFSHANSFPASTYRVMFRSLRSRGFTVKAIEKLGHDPAYPVTNNWPYLAKQLADFTRAEVEKTGTPAHLVGHSLGGFLSLMVAARHPELAQSVLLLDSPIVGGWQATALKVAKGTQLVGRVSPARVSHKRRTTWPDRDAALAHFQGKKAFARWEPQVLKDYIDHGMQMDDGKYSLSFTREVESAIYNALPDNLDRLLRKHPVKCPVSFIGGLHSSEMKQVGMTMTDKLAKGRITMMDGSHLFPMEKPLQTAAAIEVALKLLY